MKLHLLSGFYVFLLVLISIELSGQATVAWVNYPNAVCVTANDENQVYSAYWDYNPAGDITLTKRSPNGDIIWQTGYDNTDNTRHEVATWVEVDGAGDVLVSGTIRSGYSNPVNAASLLMKFSPDGALLWRVVYESDFEGTSTKKCLVDGENNIYVLGTGFGPSGFALKVKKFNPDGSTIWNYYNSAGIGAPQNFKFTPDNAIVIVGRAPIGSINGYAKVDLNGNEIWSLAGVNSLTVGDIAGDNFGQSYVINGDYTPGATGSILTKLNPTGQNVWSSGHPSAGFRVEVGPDQNPIICGFPNANIPGTSFAKFNPDGGLMWQLMDADGPGVNLLAHAQMKMDPTGAAYLVAGNLFQMGVCKVTSSGAPGWTVLAGSGYGVALAFDADYNVIVGGGQVAKITQNAGIVFGCMDMSACNFAPEAIVSDDSCVYPGCIIPEACNFNPAAGCSDGSCEFSSCLGSCPGDFDGNGVVNFSDFSLLLTQFGCEVACQADLNADGIVNFSDLVILQSNFGLFCP